MVLCSQSTRCQELTVGKRGRSGSYGADQVQQPPGFVAQSLQWHLHLHQQGRGRTKLLGYQAGKTTLASGLQLQGCQLGQLLPPADSSLFQERLPVGWKTPCTGTRTLFVFLASGEPQAGCNNAMVKGLTDLDQTQSPAEL